MTGTCEFKFLTSTHIFSLFWQVINFSKHQVPCLNTQKEELLSSFLQRGQTLGILIDMLAGCGLFKNFSGHPYVEWRPNMLVTWILADFYCLNKAM